MKFLLKMTLFFIGTYASLAQSNIDSLEIDSNRELKSFSIGLKVGAPNVIGGGAEYVLPFLDHHFSVYGDLSSFNLEVEEAAIDLSYSEFGLNYYFNSKGKGLYFGAGLGRFNSDLVISDIELDGNRTGEGSVGLNINTTNLKLGLKTGGTFYFRIELGYGMGSVPDQLVFNATSSDGYSDTVTEEVPDIPGISDSGILIGNIGFGISF